MAYSLLEITYGLTGSFRAGDTGPSPMFWANNSPPGTVYAGSGSLQGWWRLDTDVSTSGGVTDSSNNSRDGTFDGATNRPSFSTLTPSSQFIQTKTNTFDGTNDSINVGTATTWDAIIGNDTTGGSTRQMSFAAWVYKTGDGGGGQGRIFDFGGDIKVYTDTSERIHFGARWNSADVLWRTDSGIISLNTWNHVVVVYDASSVALGVKPKIYVDGVEVTVPSAYSGTVNGNFEGIDTEPCYVGGKWASFTSWEGNLADMSVWNKALTPDEIKAIYQVQNTGPYKIVRNFDSRGSKATPGFTGSVSRFIQGYNVDSYDRFGSAIAPLIGRADVNNVFLSSSSGMIQADVSSKYFDDSRKLANDIPAWPTLSASIDSDPNSATYGKVTYTRIAPVAKTVTIGDDDYRIIETPGYVMEQRAFGYEREWAENAEPFAELSKWDPTRYLENQLTYMWPVVLSNPNAIDPFEFSGVIEPFEIRKRITQTGTFIGDYDDPYPTGIKAGVSSGEIIEATRRRNFALSNFFNVKSNQSLAPFGSAQSPEITELTDFMPVMGRITSASIARLDNLDYWWLTGSYVNAKQNLSRSLMSFRGPNYPMVGAATGTIEHYQDNFVYERFLETTYDETIYNWRRYFGVSLPYLLTSGGWSGNDPSKAIGFPELSPYAYGASTNLVGWWKLDKPLTTGSAQDYAQVPGVSHPGIFESNRPTFAEVSPSIYIQTGSNNFDTLLSHMYIGTAATWDAIIGNDTVGGSEEKMTFALWFYPDSVLLASATRPNEARLFDFGKGDLALWYNTGGQRLVFGCKWTDTDGIGSNGFASWTTDAGTVLLDSWNHIVITYDATSKDNNPRLYLNGTDYHINPAGSLAPWFRLADPSMAPAGSYSGIDSQKCYVANRYGHNRPFLGKIADFAIWNRDLTKTEALSIYNAAVSGPYVATASYSLNKPKTALMGRPEFTSKSTSVGFTYANNETGIDSLAFMGLKK